jgi:hypothetical protein
MEKKFYAVVLVSLTSFPTSDAQPSQSEKDTLAKALKALLLILHQSHVEALSDEYETLYEKTHTLLYRHTLHRKLNLRSISEHCLHHQIQVVIHYLALFDIQCELVLTGRLEPEA